MTNKTKIKTSEFHSNVKKSIKLIGSLEISPEDKKLLYLLNQNGIEENHAIEILTFLPIAFVRKMLPNINWQENYIELLSDKKQRTKRFSENQFYSIIESETKNYFRNKPESETIIKIAGRSAEFKVISDLLLKHENADITEIKFTKNVILRNK
ncbi:hypothetical protein ACG2LH_08315 [Zhouia sp. PK063]|uniref:hypothetical protein n=1 Tax=Zhouia sp. PK063 TaxID=3373602 RepID=UPI003792C7B4